MRLAVLPDNRFYVALVHPGNTSPKRPSGARWRPAKTAEVHALLGEDEAFYRGAASGSAPRRRQGGAAPTPAEIPAETEARDADPRAENLHVTVSIPFHGHPRMLRRAVESILQQTHRELTAVVVNDGGPSPWSALEGLDDPRLVRFDLPVNRGRYFADAVVLASSRSPFFLVQDADDWSEPQRIATLLRRLRAEHASGAVSASRRHRGTSRGALAAVETWPALARPLTAALEHRANHHGLFRAEALRAIGGYYGGFRIGYDTLLVNLLLMTGRLTSVEEALYHRTIHAASLSNSPQTGMHSAARRQATEGLRRMYAQAFAIYSRYLEGTLDRETLCAEIRQIARAQVPPEAAAALEREAQRLGKILSRPALRSEAASRGTAPALIDDPALPWSDWGIDKAFARELLRHLETTRPRRLLEVGSGTSTVLLADWAARRGASLVSLEHEPRYFAQTAALLERQGLRDRVDLKLAPLTPFACGGGRGHPWYAAELAGPFDFVLVDGPPERLGRQAALFAVAPHLAERWHLWLHDALRPHEQSCVTLWSRWFSFTHTLSTADPRGALLLEGRGDGAKPVSSRESALGIGLLTGGRPDLLRRTVDTLRVACPGLLEESVVIALLNGDDPQTAKYLDGLPFLDEQVRHTGGVLPIGPAVSRLMAAFGERREVGTILHLEDDWAADTATPPWLERVRAILDEHPEVGQVRLRHREERVLTHHMVTRRAIRWEHQPDFLLAPSAHYTLNPSLIRARDLPAIFPCRSEEDAQRHFLRAGFATAQWLPGVFRHIGAHRSRRLQMEPSAFRLAKTGT